ncbi:Hypothetical predicted protein [Olea europaea subsp. europaea]|uniref:Uncharacterized protein n=1 Tax=Olea europaea subsp. europaea TaxID=158383 RepID=A0A8S0TXG4_OLEEU|nr:Hypothetical predicted protein [Olea europaea subsp. europaea]
MAYIRLLEITPLIFERLSRNSGIILENVDTIKWLHDLTDLGKSSSDAVVRYWKETLAFLLGLIEKVKASMLFHQQRVLLRITRVRDVKKVGAAQLVNVKLITSDDFILGENKLWDGGFNIYTGGIYGQSQCLGDRTRLQEMKFNHHDHNHLSFNSCRRLD